MSPVPAVLAASDTGKGSPIGLFVVLLLIVAVYLLYRSMSGRLRRLPERFPGYGAAGTDGAGADGITTAAAATPDTDDTRTDDASPDDLGAQDAGTDDSGSNSGDKRR
ncbi:MAG: sortase B protein-sorting domain-containing protein [Jatrophihabitantaceae bacterium]